MANTKYGLTHKGSVNKLSFSLKLFIALNISMVTRIDRLIVVAFLAIQLVNMAQLIEGNWLSHLL